MTITVRLAVKDPDALGDVCALLDFGQGRQSEKYIECCEYATLELTVFARDGVPCIASARFVPLGEK